MLHLFHDEDAGAFADHESVTIFVPGAAGLFRLVIARGQCAHGSESAYAHGTDGGFRATSDHDLGIAVLDDAEGIPDGMGACRAGRGCRLIRALGPYPHGYLPGGEIHNGCRNEE